MSSDDPIRTVAVAKPSKELLYSEYLNIPDAEHVIEVAQHKGISKPVMQFKKSSVVDRVNDLINQMKQSQEHLSEKECNIENLEDSEAVIEMNVALYTKTASEDELKNDLPSQNLTDVIHSDSSCENSESDSESSCSSSEHCSRQKLITELEDASEDDIDKSPPKKFKSK